MQICIHRKDNSPQPVNHRLTLKEEPKVKSNNIRRYPAHDILQVGFTLQTSRINNKRVISTFKFGCPHLNLKEGLKVNSDHIRRFPVSDLWVPEPWIFTRIKNHIPEYLSFIAVNIAHFLQKCFHSHTHIYKFGEDIFTYKWDIEVYVKVKKWQIHTSTITWKMFHNLPTLAFG